MNQKRNLLAAALLAVALAFGNAWAAAPAAAKKSTADHAKLRNCKRRLPPVRK
jgi:hypothetical protein